jgi:O-antigen/teichoic acid export membrane protein
MSIQAEASLGQTRWGRLAGRAVRGGAVLLAARLATQVFVWAVTLLVARLLRPDDYGMMTLGTIFLCLADILAEAGFGKALIQKEHLNPADLARAFTISLALAALLYLALFAVAGPAGGFFDKAEFGPFLRVLALVVLVVPFETVPLALLDRELHMGRQAAVHVVCAVVQAGVVLGLALAGFGYWALAAGAMVARLLKAAALAGAAGWKPRLLWPGPESRPLLAFGMHASLGTLLWFLSSNADFAILGRLSGATALGFYSLAFQLISLPVQKLTANANQAAYPVFCRLQNDLPRLRDWYLRLTVLLGFLGMPALAGMALVAEDAFAVLLGERWLPAVPAFRWLSVVGILMVYGATLPPLLNARGRPDVVLRYTAACAVLYPCGFLVGARLGGVTGVCIAWLVLYPLVVSALFLLTRSLTGVGLGDLVRAQLPVVAAVLFMAVVVLLLRGALPEACPPWQRLLAAVVAGAAAYAGALFALARRTVLADLSVLARELRGGTA